MTQDELRSLIARGETLDVEFKGEEREPLNDSALIEAVVCMANRPGNSPGLILIGVENDRRITGARPRHEGGQTDTIRVQALVANRTHPPVGVQAELLTLDQKAVLVLEVPASSRVIATSDGKCLRRVIGGDGRPACVPYYHGEVTSRLADLGQVDYSAFTVHGVAGSDLDPLEFERFRRTIRESKGAGDTSLLDLSDPELARALGVATNDGGLRVAALLLFGKEDAIRAHLPAHEAAFQELADTAVRANDFFRWPLLRVMEELMGRFRARYKEKEVFSGMVRVGVPDYPERAFREAVANALIHRDYTRLGAVHVQWHGSHIEISNPGGLPEGVRLDNLLVTAPHPRNPLLADAFKRAGIVERTGRGVDSIFRELLRNGGPAPNYGRTTVSAVTVVLPKTGLDHGFVRLVAKQDRAGRELKLDELLVARSILDRRRLSTRETATLIQKGESEAATVLEALVEAGLLNRARDAYTPSRLLLSFVVKRKPRQGLYGLTPEEQEKRVLDWVRMNKAITRAKVKELCGLQDREATYLLRKLLDAGKLAKTGTRRWTKYVLPEKGL